MTENEDIKRRMVWHTDVVVKQLISYAVGCMMGRYSLDRKGLILANQGDGLKEYETLVPDSRFAIDEDGILPLMPSDSEFTDNVPMLFKKWLAVAFGEDTLTWKPPWARTSTIISRKTSGKTTRRCTRTVPSIGCSPRRKGLSSASPICTA